MNHLTEDQFAAAYYGELNAGSRLHLEDCEECRSEFGRLRQLLNDLRDCSVPEPGQTWERDLWSRISPQLPAPRSRGLWLRWWVAVPALAAVAAIAFVAGMFIQRQQQTAAGIARTASERVLLVAIGDHLDRSQIVLAELVNAPAGSVDLTDERIRARDLLTENRLLRQTALHAGEATNAAVLDDLERVLLDIANSSSNPDPDTLEAIQRRIESEGLLFKVRIVSTNVRQKGRKL